ncbi:hypothetical protein GCM10010218_45550 [Streptomyces mashuensis]|uniref:DUF6777 domain-containing protein n=1 Tax=Streptomyces mashuensis TaxID=33904 RepID=A0A919B5B7_9ACTN|nr:DUF6777 domain-containing protein [Streptomyces mashuensis]GHF59039.1 hypothetical protein GCM10010218_45550 [Streptomyces mashuensis]
MQRTRRIVALAAVPALILGAALTGCSSSGSSGSQGTPVALEAAGVVADSPFLKAPDADLKDVTGVATTNGTTAGDARGAFGGTRQATQCDKAKLVRELTADRVKAMAWAEARGIPFDQVSTHINGLTSVILLHDTLVKNHNYQGGGKTVAYHSVLQAGIAVLVDAYGQPAVKCNCGNPLGTPDDIDRAQASYRGSRWSGFAVVQVTVVVPRPEKEGPMKKIPLVDPYRTDKGFDRGVGSTGSDDSPAYPVPPQAPRPSASPGSPSGGPSGSASGPASGSGSPPGPGDGSSSGTPTGPSSGGSAGASGGPSGGPSAGSPSGPGTGGASRPPSRKPPAPSTGGGGTGGSGTGGGGTVSRAPSAAPHTAAPASPKSPWAPPHTQPPHSGGAAVPPTHAVSAHPPAASAPPAHRSAAPPAASGAA